MVNIVNWDNYKTKQEWLDARRKIQGVGEAHTRVSASDISVITGSNPYKSKRRLFLAMTGLYNKDFISRTAVQGQVMENKVKEYIESFNPESEDETLVNLQNGVKLRSLKQAEFFLLNDKYPHLSASLDFIPDGEVYSPFTGELYHPLTPFECKYINPMVYKTWEDGISQDYLEQCTLQSLLAETPLTVFGVLRWDFNFSMMEIPFDKDLAEYLVEVSGEFCRDVTKVKLLKAKFDLSADEVEKHELECMMESIVPLDHTDDNIDVINETTIDGDLMYVVDPSSPDDSELDDLMERYLTNGESIKMLDYDQNLIRSTLTLKADGYNGIESERFKATIRSGSGEKGKYFRINKKKGQGVLL